LTEAWFLQKYNKAWKGCIAVLGAFCIILVLPLSESLSSEGHRLMALPKEPITVGYPPCRKVPAYWHQYPGNA